MNEEGGGGKLGMSLKGSQALGNSCLTTTTFCLGGRPVSEHKYRSACRNQAAPGSVSEA